ncbi:MAG TPA: DUF2891 domain-containing protein [Planctomycetaceae bacterium]|nr:DUF2891 domain-containing protein [Planctomycetaceae bacterium]
MIHPEELDPAAAARFARLALDCLDREYPNHVLHLLTDETDVRPPRDLTPAFYGCFDWHSAVHAHWLLVRLLRFVPSAGWADEARAALDRHLTAANIAAELEYLSAPGREGFERPYGLAWLLQLAAELSEWHDDRFARRWRLAIEPLERLAVARLSEWLPKLTHPIRSGEHSQTAFAMGLALDWARTTDEAGFERLLRERSQRFYGADRNAPLSFEPSGHDFLSPVLAEADLMRRVLTGGDFARWFDGFLPDVPHDGSTAWLEPAAPADRRDGKLAHLDGLNLSRAWMLEGIAAGLSASDPRRASLLDAAREHRAAGLPAVTGEHYAGGHWLGTFAVYLTTCRGTGGGGA